MPKSFIKNVTYLLIIGAPRSGTTLLASLISAHDDVAMLIEDRNFSIRKLTGKRILANKLCIPNQIELSTSSNSIIKYFKKYNLFQKRSTSKYSIDDYLKLPSIKIISIIRNPNNVISSIIERGKKNKNIALYRWSRAIEIIDYLKNKYLDKVLIVSFERLVNEPENVIRIVSQFLQIEYQSKMLDGAIFNILYDEGEKIDPTKAENKKNIVKDLEILQPYNFLKYQNLLRDDSVLGDRIES